MANTISTQISTTSTIDNVRVGGSSNTVTTLVNNNYTAGNTYPISGSYTAITYPTDVLNIWISNDNSVYTASIIKISGSGTPALSNPIGAKLIPGTSVNIPWSGSIASLSAQVCGTYSASAGTGTALTGSLQYVIQSS